MASYESLAAYLYQTTSFFGIALSLLLIVIIITKTPRPMKSYKNYLLIYTCNSLLLELLCGLYGPVMLHPYVYFYPIGPAKYFPRNLSFILFAASFYNEMCMYDCCIAMVLQRYLVMRNELSTETSRIPKFVFWVLSFLGFGYLAFVAIMVFYEPINNYFLMSVDESHRHLAMVFGKNFEPTVIETVIIFRGLEVNALPFMAKVLIGTIGIRVIILLILLFLNAQQSQKLKASISGNLQNANQWLMKMIGLQLIGIIVFMVFPIMVVIVSAMYISEPTQVVTYCFIFLEFFGFYDSVVTIICIKPYRVIFIEGFKKLMRIRKS